MRFTTYLSPTGPRLGLVTDDGLIDLASACPEVPSDLLTALRQNVNLADAAERAIHSSAPRLQPDAQQYAPVIPAPGKIICLGLNYFDHAKEGGRDKPAYPWFFLRTASSLVGHGQDLWLPRVSAQLDYEAELAVVIGQRVPRHIAAEHALPYVFGYSCFNDVSVRDYQKKTPQWTIGKNFDASGALGPNVVTANALPPGATNLRIQSRLNGAVMQDANTADMIWGVAETLALLSTAMTLEPGDVIAMGTPAGVGQSRQPPVWLQAGDHVEVDIEGVGLLSNPVRPEP